MSGQAIQEFPDRGWIMTASGRQFFPLSPRAEDIAIEDIAHALAAMNRFNGHTREPYSVAQHSVLVSIEMERRGMGNTVIERGLYGLLHDASEAYLCDIPRPLKCQPAFRPYKDAEATLSAAIYRAFGLDPDGEPEDLKRIDRKMLRTEQRDLMPPAAHGENRDDVEPFAFTVRPWPAFRARDVFLCRFRDLKGRRR